MPSSPPSCRRRSGAQGDDPAHRHGARRHPATPRCGAPDPPATELDDALAVRLAGSAGGTRLRHRVHRRPRRPRRRTDLARHMVREWGMSDRLGHIAWGAQDRFLGEELIHTRDYSDETATSSTRRSPACSTSRPPRPPPSSPTTARSSARSPPPARTRNPRRHRHHRDPRRHADRRERRGPRRRRVGRRGTRRRPWPDGGQHDRRQRTSLTLGDRPGPAPPGRHRGAGRHAADDRSHAVGGVGGRRRRRHRPRAGGSRVRSATLSRRSAKARTPTPSPPARS